MILMTGVYDFACTPEMTEQTADKIRNAECIIMKEIGHFPMCENPEAFKKYLMPVLDRLLDYARDRRPSSISDRTPRRDEASVRAASRRW
jgi:pimeloyl-ACP methyl ester carboxylesterase